MTQPYVPLRPQRPIRDARRGLPWLTILGVGLLALLAGVILALLLSGRDDGREIASSPGATETGSQMPSGSASTAPSGSPIASASSASPSATAVPVAADTIVATTVDGLAVRSAAGRSAEQLGSLAVGSQGFVVSGPTDADGYGWYLVSALGLPPATGCAGLLETDPYNCPAWFGWVAGASDTGSPWLQPVDLDCPAEPFTAEALILARTDIQRLACRGGEPFTFRAWWPEIPDDAGLGGACAAQDRPSGWLLCQGINYNQVTISETEGYGGVGARISIDPASGLSMPERGTWVEVRVHLDDPAAQGCADGAEAVYAEPIPEQAVLDCRAQMVLEAVTVVDGP